MTSITSEPNSGTVRRVPDQTPPRRRSRVPKAPYAFVLPAVFLFVFSIAIPILYTAYLSLRTVKVEGLGLGPGARTEVWAGLENYAGTLTDRDFLSSVLRVLGYGLVVIPVMLGLALLFALLLDSVRVRARRFSRLVIFMPYAVPAVISSLLWGFLYLPAVSPFTYAADQVGVTLPQPMAPGLVLFGIANIAVWGGVGFNMIVLYTALRSIPTELYEAARIDGCSEVQIAWRIKVPIVIPSLIMTSVFGMITTLQVFAEPTVLRPLTNNISTSWSPLMMIYRDAFTRNDIYSASATSVVLAVATFVLSFGFLRLVQNRAFAQENR
ncbi:sugar ABC transporter permease [Kineosporia sp. J2-2]|uniref:Sugar ABC transporter permease n=1 Tax=Kineosporia corallincola TaxID=2835133 RepID=A0ABS5TH90_9ACTN|nr:sugar ABC transporter permease [Kineosporia corallincola]MBT0769541.1 sugar ABC transporter permease [Kineosporia corallincola]